MVKAADGRLVSQRADLEYHDHRTTGALKPSECFAWIVGTSATHLVPASADAELRATFRDAFDPISGSCRSESNDVYFWDGHKLSIKPHLAAFDALERAAEQLAGARYVAPACEGAVPLPRVPGE